MKRRRRRNAFSYLGWSIAWLAAALVLFGLFDLLGSIVWRGVRSFHFAMLFTPTQGVAGGLENAILGTFELVLIAVLFAAPLGILGGVYTSEFAGRRTAAVIRFLAEVLSGVPSIVIGYFGYLLLVLQFHWGFSALAGGIALTLIMLPYILRTTDTSLQQVPHMQREAAWALGMTRSQAILKAIWRPAAGGIATGLLLAIAIGLGETAPLLYTAGWNANNPSLQLTHAQVGYLTYVAYTYLDQPYPAARDLAYAAAFVLLVVILIIQLVVRGLVWRTTNRLQGRH
ncbi:phosphate ABC transporter, inner membrane subunit PstA [Alicyclobacillus hesperidum URH17-3-68]|uniref:Phosphate transport system permease protein PstA n=1 Tax=Alicyclobacillus hesperidum TaxID=89784 RepID=A0A1H2U1C8_9BACL|nr:phosphate ABC transporter permease PstA [Alicyclobacillus hesperidum]EJY54783.1 phosphate ABC transporter, inner membrane subunit PstA [Alicyclobacillus hesperidum URH17-3-68]GLV14040.1 phosphate transport system permease protein PstA 2 [Alicyclobacillus hesperidum]SDW50023.1 phosphate ABC transporter membrane protein 2, PhoT family [Alicyclobacillus hesperidum]